ncbi:MAG: acetyl-CoA carboxylase biotin carboxyl carrier protein [Deinococcales bacterium]|jgi:acetyl-CoA carboxylase biotin carboxyl carrier protein
MDVKDIKRLLDALAASEVREFSYETEEYKLNVKRGPEPVVTQTVAAAPQPAPQPAPPPAQPAAPAEEAPSGGASQPAAEEPPSNWVEVSAPIVGTFYASPAPDAPAYVKVGDRVEPGAVLCIIEAMKLMNEIEAETAGVVREVLVRNEEPVEYGQVLFRIEPA